MRPAKVNVDSQGVILKGYDVVAYFKQGKPVKGNPAILEHLSGRHVLVCFGRRIKPILTKIPENMLRSMAHFVPTE